MTLNTESATGTASEPDLPVDAALGSVQRQLFDLLNMSPRLKSALSSDSSLLGYSEYVKDRNPALGRFLEGHPEIIRLKSEINGVPVGVKAPRRTENKSVLILADGLHPDLVIVALFEAGQGCQY